MAIPVIDLFAGPGGLGEGFSSLRDDKGENVFKIVLSIEKEYFAHQTLTLRSFFRQFRTEDLPESYYDFLKGMISLNQLFDSNPKEAGNAAREAWQATLGDGNDAVSSWEVDSRISNSLNGKKNWVLIGGPPCQAYSVIGRSRRREKILDESTDQRVGLYKQYLRILSVHSPPIFIMENVKGILSAETKESPVFSKIYQDLTDPAKIIGPAMERNLKNDVCPGYKIFSLVKKANDFNLLGEPVYSQGDFVINAEKFGIPQARQRVILVGIRNDITKMPDVLGAGPHVPIKNVISGLPRLRCGLSSLDDSGENWKHVITGIRRKGMLSGVDSDVVQAILKRTENLHIPNKGTGKEYIPCKVECKYLPEWFIDQRIDGVCNHTSRSHIEGDLLRYFFASCFADVKKISPRLGNFPVSLLPDHRNVEGGIEGKMFADRFRVQLYGQTSKTITSHISKDGHYYIHPDASQCRSLTVREAARIQTFPDNYYFCGPRTAQYIQVGNAVPPYLAYQISKVVHALFQKLSI